MNLRIQTLGQEIVRINQEMDRWDFKVPSILFPDIQRMFSERLAYRLVENQSKVLGLLKEADNCLFQDTPDTGLGTPILNQPVGNMDSLGSYPWVTDVTGVPTG